MSAVGRAYGTTLDWFVVQKHSAAGAVLAIGGTTRSADRWIRLLSRRAAIVLWLRLTEILYPDHFKSMNAQLGTLPIRDSALPTVTNQVILEMPQAGVFELTGSAGGHAWTAQFDDVEAQRLWSALNSALSLVQQEV